MLFNSLVFLVFLPVFLLLYYGTRGNARLWVCLISSYYFYGYWDWRFLSLIWISTGVGYFLGLGMEKNAPPAKRKWLVSLSVIVNLTILGFFKYFNFFIDSFTAMLRATGLDMETRAFNIILPVGISFYTFQTLSYSIDLYRKRIPVERSLLRFATFVALFPQLVAGPIVRASTLLPQLHKDNRPTWNQVLLGVQMIFWGYFLKVGLADSIALVSDSRFGNPYLHSSLSMMVGVFCYSFQLYGDFCGYSLIAIGVGRILGFDFGLNFDRPYFSTSFSEYWRRWHISLSTWLRDYLFVPLGGFSRNARRVQWALVGTMFLGGLWHGANWTFAVWGMLHGFYLTMQRILGPRYAKFVEVCRIPNILAHIFLVGMVFGLNCIALIFFRSQSIADAFIIIGRILSFDDLSPGSILYKFNAAKAFVLIAFVYLVELLSFKLNYKKLAADYPVLLILASVGTLLAISFFSSFTGQTFIYFRF